MTSILTIPERLFARHVLVPTDLGPDGDRAVAHALRIAAAIPDGAELTLLHVGGSEEEARELLAEMPSVRASLEKWGLLSPSSPRSAVRDVLGVEVRKVIAEQHGTVSTILGYTKSHAVDLLVVGTRGDAGLPRWLSRSVSETVAANVASPTLFIPREASGFVDEVSGAVTMKRILCPVNWEPHPARAVTSAVAAASAFGEGDSEIVLFHVGDEEIPLALPEVEGVSYRSERVVADVDVVGAILAAAEREPTDLITMVTNGRDNFGDTLRGTDTERVIRHAPCPVLSSPAQTSPG